MKEKQVTKFFLACSTLVTCITLGINLTFRHAAHAVIAESGEVSPTATADFITSIGETARQIGQERNLYASVMIAQAVLESNSGQSALSQQPYYNFFGIKGAYNGNSVTMQTWEDDGSGYTYEVDQDFRKLICTFDAAWQSIWHGNNYGRHQDQELIECGFSLARLNLPRRR